MEVVSKPVLDTPTRGRAKALGIGHAHGVALDKGRSLGAAPAKLHACEEVPTRGRARVAFPKPQVEIGEDLVPPDFGDPLF